MNTIIEGSTVQSETPGAAWLLKADAVQNWTYWDNAFTPEECEKIIEIGNSKILKSAVVGAKDGGLEKNTVIRDSKIAWLYGSDNMEWVFRRMTDIINSLNTQYFNFELTGFCEGFQFTKYEAPSGNYGMHIDRMIGHMVRKLSITIQLSDPESYKGGDLAIQIGMTPELMKREQGHVVVFPSYVLHEVQPVTEGTRYSLVAWINGPAFK